MVAPKKSKGILGKQVRNERIVMEFKKQKKNFPDSKDADCLRGLADAFEVHEQTIRRVLKKAELL